MKQNEHFADINRRVLVDINNTSDVDRVPLYFHEILQKLYTSPSPLMDLADISNFSNLNRVTSVHESSTILESPQYQLIAEPNELCSQNQKVSPGNFDVKKQTDNDSGIGYIRRKIFNRIRVVIKL